jgi:hypothetical protein
MLPALPRLLWTQLYTYNILNARLRKAARIYDDLAPLEKNEGSGMAKVTVLYWQNIPSLVEAADSGGVQKRQLSQRFQELIDLIAMKKRMGGTDEYLEHWRKGSPEMREGPANVVATAAVEEIEARYEEIRAAVLAEC